MQADHGLLNVWLCMKFLSFEISYLDYNLLARDHVIAIKYE